MKYNMLQVKDLSLRYHKKQVLNKISFNIAPGQAVAVIGESGAGKTSLALAIGRLTEGAQVTGQILFNGQNILSLSEQEMRQLRWNKISFVFQNMWNSLNPVLPVIDQVAEPVIAHRLMMRDEAFLHARRLLIEAGLDEDKHRHYPHMLSGGEKQRVSLAMALANKPRLVIMDEPTASLDAVTKGQILAQLCRLKGKKSFLLVTHDLSAAAMVAHWVLVLYNGVIVEAGPAELVFKEPRHPYTRGLIRCYPNMDTTKDLVGIKGQMIKETGGCCFSNRCTQTVAPCFTEIPPLVPVGKGMLACHRGGVVPLLQVQGLTKHYGRVAALNGVDLTLYEGETLGLVGASGSGKSTLAYTVMGLEKPNRGRILLEGEEIKKRDRGFYQRVQMIFQHPLDAINHRSMVVDAVREPLDVQKVGTAPERLARVKQCLQEVELPTEEEFLHTYPHHLSGGEIQRLTIARALAVKPKMLIADEPTSALDASVQAKVLKLLLSLQEKYGLAILFITHDLALARKVSDRIAVMHQGKIVEEGRAADITSKPQRAYTKQLLQSAARLFV
ncbi:ABC transporter ATP-binding protein [Desulfofalx alkaliphila]|uniref:ABC transporter ATP-binding protein n=1 Tax=Desulfofalx alkaliphila TaxID=105483 RepID=UPI001EE413CD|nr:ABC transporter ATP-binding protein [Desulfofalx alkaliphila]